MAHRGLFNSRSEQNTHLSISRALSEGYGIETDLRDLDGEVVVSHDPPTFLESPPTLAWLLEQVNQSPSDCRIALNIKSCGIANRLASMVSLLNVDPGRIFAFDMSVPDLLSYHNTIIPVYTRLSELEIISPLVDKSQGVWVDSFNGAFHQTIEAGKLMMKGIRAAVVSSELHHRDHHELWDNIHSSGIYKSPLFEICTDFPDEAVSRFCID